MSLRDDLLPVVDAGRQLAADLGLRQRVVKIRRRVWASGRIGSPTPAGPYTDTDTTLSPPPKVREPPGRLVHETAGKFVEGDLQISKISADYTDAELAGTTTAGTEWFVLVDDVPYRVVGAVERRNFECRLLVRKVTGRGGG